ncbi:unnamed protein product [Protopolystoma xenopodis]|uniref:Uncharacterized protein n=1 Tax=Protopolystoma xenopodis TaxID=117903 RepID=A0A3S5CRV3_9PLAT|nr:unnamed protein product [Protopolystoma xenopodis]
MYIIKTLLGDLSMTVQTPKRQALASKLHAKSVPGAPLFGGYNPDLVAQALIDSCHLVHTSLHLPIFLEPFSIQPTTGGQRAQSAATVSFRNRIITVNNRLILSLATDIRWPLFGSKSPFTTFLICQEDIDKTTLYTAIVVMVIFSTGP